MLSALPIAKIELNKRKVKFAQSGFTTGMQDGENLQLLTQNKITTQTESTKCYLFFCIKLRQNATGDA